MVTKEETINALTLVRKFGETLTLDAKRLLNQYVDEIEDLCTEELYLG